MEINFIGINGEVIESSEHGNYLVVKLSSRISITGTFSNIWQWEESHEEESGFISFLTYIGFNNENVRNKYLDLITEMGGYFKDEKEEKRGRKRVQGRFNYEMKVRGLSPDNVLKLINIK